MPKENKKRGRRAEAQKRKVEEIQIEQRRENDSHVKKRRRTLESDSSATRLAEDTNYPSNDPAYEGQNSDNPFYGLLDEQEQEYFKRADGILELNQFENPEERSLFLENVYKEADGKELKLACSQSCSRLLERLILLSSPRQLKSLFGKFSGHFLNLIQHRFASHCCETLFVQSAPVVTLELLEPSIEIELHKTGNAEPIASMENLFLHSINELSGNIGYLMTDQFASHTLRILLVVLAGQKLDMEAGNSVLKSKKKEHVEIIRGKDSKRIVLENRAVPDAFTSTLEKLIDESISGLETHYLRTLATHPVGNPMLQLLVQLELANLGKQRAKDKKSIIRTLLPDDPITEGTDSASFINSLVYDPIGSRLLETIVKNAPGKIFKSIYKELFKERIGSLARNEISSYVVSKILERLSREDLEAAVGLILPQIPNLAKRGRTAIIKTLVERCEVRGVDTMPLSRTLQETYSEDGGETLSISKLLCLPSEDATAPAESQQHQLASTKSSMKSDLDSSHWDTTAQWTNSSTAQSTKHASLLAQSMLRSVGPLSITVFGAISALPAHVCVHLALNPTLSPILQTSLTVAHSPLIFRRKLITRFYSHISALSLDSSGSHVVDAIWKGTRGMAFARERVAEELAENENALRASFCGRKVWKNWNMDLYRRRRGEWVRMMRESVGNDGFLSFPSGSGRNFSERTRDARGTDEQAASADNRGIAASDGVKKIPVLGSVGNANGRSKLDLARQRHAKARERPSIQKGEMGGARRIENLV